MTDIVEQTKAIIAMFIVLMFLLALLPAFSEIGSDPMSTVIFSIAGILLAIAIFLSFFKR
jgi:uncharacterized membrane protein